MVSCKILPEVINFMLWEYFSYVYNANKILILFGVMLQGYYAFSLPYTMWVFYLETSKYLKKYVLYEKNVRNKNVIFEAEKQFCKNLPHTLGVGRGVTLKFQMDTSIFYCKFWFFIITYVSFIQIFLPGW